MYISVSVRWSASDHVLKRGERKRKGEPVRKRETERKSKSQEKGNFDKR